MILFHNENRGEIDLTFDGYGIDLKNTIYSTTVTR